MSSSLNATSSTGAAQAGQSQWAQTRSDFQQLNQALSSGNLTAAQQAFNAIQQNGQGGTGQSSLAAIGQALQSGDLSGAQQALSQVQQTAGQHHHHHHRAAQDSTDAAAPATAAAVPDPTGVTGTSVNVTA